MKKRLRPILCLCDAFLCCIFLSAQQTLPDTPSRYSLTQLLNSAAQLNPSVRIADMQERQARLSVNEAWGALFPVIDGGLFAQYQTNPLTLEDIAPGYPEYFQNLSGKLGAFGIPPMPPLPETEHWGFQVQAGLTQPLFTWGKIANSVSLAKTGLEARAIQKLIVLRENETQIAARCGVLYYLRQMNEIVSRQETAARRLQKITADNLKNGLILPLDASAVDVQLMQIAAGKARLADQENQTLASLRQLTGIETLTVEMIDYSFIPEDLSALPRPALADAENFISSGSSESSLLRTQEKAADIQRKIIGSDAWGKPDIGLKLGYTFSTPRFFFSDPEWQTKGRWDFTAAIAINSTLFNGLRDISQLKKAELDTEIAKQETVKNISALKNKLRELDSSLALKTVLINYFNLREQQNVHTIDQKKKELDSGYSDETAFLKAELTYYTDRLESLQNFASFFSDYCVYLYLCGQFPSDYLAL